MAKAFTDNKINGAVLMCLNEDHMKEMGCAVLGKGWGQRGACTRARGGGLGYH